MSHSPSEPLPSKDLVSRLRAVSRSASKWAIVSKQVEDPEYKTIYELITKVADESADEIERLRTALTGISTCGTCEACRGAALRALGGEVPAARKPDKFDLAFEIMRQLEAEDMETMQSCQFGYVMRVTRERAAKPPGDE